MPRIARPYFWNILLLIFGLIFSVGVGAVFIPPATLLRILAAQIPALHIEIDWVPAFSDILLKIRLPHTILMALTGAALGGSGAAYQGLFRNPLADPYLIGVASGAGLGAVAGMALHWPTTQLGFFAIPLAAFLGAMFTIFLVYSLAKAGSTLPITTLILSGVAVSSFFNALTSFLMLQSRNEIHRALAWLLGGSTIGGWEPVIAAAPYIVIGLLLLILSSYALNVLQFGEEQAQHLGLNVERTKILLIIATSTTTAAAVAFSGLIGFIGLIIPHLMRLLCGPDYRHLIPLSILGGSTGLIIADIVARSILAPEILPVGIVTALTGAPFFLWVLRRSKDHVYW